VSYLLLSSGFFLGWSLGANDGGNIFGPAISTRMVRFRMAAILAAIFVVMGAIFQGSGASSTLSALGSVNMIWGSFTVAIAAALSLFLMLKMGVPVSSSQAVVGAIVGWNLFSGSFSDSSTLAQIVSTWVITPALSGVLAIVFNYIFLRSFSQRAISLFRLDYYTRAGYLVLIAFSAYSLGANNIANVMGMFIGSSPFTPLRLFDRISISPQTQLFFLGSISIAVGIMTRSMSNAKTVGKAIFKMSPITGFIAVLSSSLVMFIFSSKSFQLLLQAIHLPTLPPVPVSSSQAIIGAIIGIGIVHNAQNINFRTIGRIGFGVVLNPILACVLCFMSLFFVQNVFDQAVYKPTQYIFSEQVMQKLESLDIEVARLQELQEKHFASVKELRQALNEVGSFNYQQKALIAEISEDYPMFVNTRSLFTLKNKEHFSQAVFEPLLSIESNFYLHKWELVDTLSELSDQWRYKPNKVTNHFYNSELDKRYELLFSVWSMQN